MGQKPKIVIRADAGKFTGFGHLVRSCALASYLFNDFDCRIVCHNDTPHADEFINKSIRDAKAVRDDLGLPAGVSLEEFNDKFLDSLDSTEMAVLDNYYYDSDYQQEVKSRALALVSVDDMPDRVFHSDLFITSSPLRKEDFEFAGDPVFLGGLKWAFLREPFLLPVSRRVGKEVRNVVIAIGGADPLRLTDKFIGIIGKILPEAVINVIAGPSARVEAEEQNQKGIHVHREVEARRVAELFDIADFGILPASTICAEAVARRLPAAVGWYMDNQLNHYRYGIGEGFFADLGDMRRPSEILEKELRGIISDYDPSGLKTIDFQKNRGEIIKNFRLLWSKKTKDA